MRYAIISDIHSNLEAFLAVLDACKKQNVEDYFCAGDIVGYGADPRECLRIVHKLNIRSVAGNHDWAVAGRLAASYFIPAGKDAVNWTRQNISIEEISYLAELPLTQSQDDFVLVHGMLQDAIRFQYLRDITDAAGTFSLLEGHKICFLGHTHIPQIYVKQGDNIVFHNSSEIEISPDAQYIINVGSVGQPRDGIPMASYCIYDTDLEMLELKRIPYDIHAAQKKILSAGLPQVLSERLSLGY